MKRNYWASRPNGSQLDYFWSELEVGRLRQGWGYHSSQDLRLVQAKNWNERTPEETETQRHRRMLGGEDGWKVGDIILIPNLPERGMFALAEVVGPYEFSMTDHDDYGHIRHVKLLTPHGIVNKSQLVSSKIRSTLRNLSRTWNIAALSEDIDALLAKLDDVELLESSTEIQRTERVFRQTLSYAIEALRDDFSKRLKTKLRAAEWEKVIAAATEVKFPGARVTHTGGATELGADFEIELANPFGGAPWIIVVQVKDYREGNIGVAVAQQLRDAIKSRTGIKDDGFIGKHVIGAVIASTVAKPSAELIVECQKIEQELKVPISFIYGDDLMEMILRGVMQHGIMLDEIAD